MKICVVGIGYVGLVTAACFAERGHEVICVDADSSKIERLKRGEMPINEPGLCEIVVKNIAAHRLDFFDRLPREAASAKVFFVAVGTPPTISGEADLSQVFSAIDAIGAAASDGSLVVVKSTVPPGTGELVRAKIDAALSERGERVRCEILSNPEFLREGSAVRDCLFPERVVIGTHSEEAERVMRDLYSDFAPSEKIFVMSPKSAEIAKYAANTMLAARISMMNEIACLCDEVGADVEDVRASLAADPRIGPYFLRAGCGYGGSCFPKDVRALVRTGEQMGLDMTFASATEKVNLRQKELMARMIRDRFGELAGMRIAVLGLAFKPETDDIREAPSLSLIRALHGMGAIVAAYDPAAMENSRRELPEEIIFASSAEEALDGAECAAVVTEWKEFRSLDWARAGEKMAAKIVFDGRNIFDPREMRANGFEYYCIGRGMTPRRGDRNG